MESRCKPPTGHMESRRMPQGELMESTVIPALISFSFELLVSLRH